MAILYLFTAAAVAYAATLLHKRYEVYRAVASEIDAQLLHALDLALSDTVDTDEESGALVGILRRVEHLTTPLPPRVRRPVYEQIHLVTNIAYGLHDKRYPLGPWILQLALHSAREVVTPLLYPPFVVPRRPGRPRSFPDYATFSRFENENSFTEALDHALDWKEEHDAWYPGEAPPSRS